MLEVVFGSIFDQECDAIVNPANQSLLAGSGLCGVIHKLAGPELEIACKKIGRQQIGNAVITPAFNLKNCQYIIHACGPRWLDGTYGERELLAKTYESILEIAQAKQLIRVAIPAISTGIYRFPANEAAAIAIDTCNRKSVGDLSITFAVNENDKFNIFQKLIRN